MLKRTPSRDASPSPGGGTKVARDTRAPSPRLRGEGRGEGDSQQTQRVESPPHPPAFAALRRATSPHKRGEVKSLLAPDAFLSPLEIDAAVERALAEDLGRAGDVTSVATVPADATARAVVMARAAGTIAGLPLVAAALRRLAPDMEIAAQVGDGAAVKAGTALMRVAGPARAILSAERVALNFLGHLSGIATATAAFVARVSHTKARICCTRKTTPGMRALAKYAVRCGGGFNHRFGLDDAILIKDNHIAVAGGIAAVLARAKAVAGHLVKVEIEVDTLAQLEEVLAAGGADAVLLDNMDPATMRRAVALVAGRLVTEASGGITLDTLAAIAETGVDYISSGALTHSAPNLDVAMDIEM
jgi:nicotinate-nucleotide pyrophosphorylase (carboxylating)